jgi:hypothetical protein
LIYKSKYKRKYPFKPECTWEEQPYLTEELLPKLSKTLNKKYTVSDTEIRKMLYTRQRSIHRQWRIKINGKEKEDKRRKLKNTEMANVRFL